MQGGEPHAQLRTVTAFRRVRPRGMAGGQRATSQWTNGASTTSARPSRPTSTVVRHADSIYLCFDVIWWKRCFTCMVFLPKTGNFRLIMRKNIKISLSKDILQNLWAVLLKAVKVITNKKRLRNCHSWMEPEETWELNIMQCPGWDSGTEKKHQVKLRKSE